MRHFLLGNSQKQRKINIKHGNSERTNHTTQPRFQTRKGSISNCDCRHGPDEGLPSSMLERIRHYFRTEPVIAVSFVLGISGNNRENIICLLFPGPVIYFVSQPIKKALGIERPLPLPSEYPLGHFEASSNNWISFYLLFLNGVNCVIIVPWQLDPALKP